MAHQLRDLNIQALKLFSDTGMLRGTKSIDDVRQLIEKIRDTLSTLDRPIGFWESVELNNAGRALDQGFPMLAIISAAKAIAVSQLLADEYRFGVKAMQDAAGLYDAATESASAEGESMTPGRAVERQRKESVRLHNEQDVTACRLLWEQEMNEYELGMRQKEDASLLKRQNKEDAEWLVTTQAQEVEILKTADRERAGQYQAQEQVINWMSGGYSMEAASAYGVVCEKSYTELIKRQQTTATELKEHQGAIAELLKEGQLQNAASLKEENSKKAAMLVMDQQRAALALAGKSTPGAKLTAPPRAASKPETKTPSSSAGTIAEWESEGGSVL